MMRHNNLGWKCFNDDNRFMKQPYVIRSLIFDKRKINDSIKQNIVLFTSGFRNCWMTSNDWWDVTQRQTLPLSFFQKLFVIIICAPFQHCDNIILSLSSTTCEPPWEIHSQFLPPRSLSLPAPELPAAPRCSQSPWKVIWSQQYIRRLCVGHKFGQCIGQYCW